MVSETEKRTDTDRTRDQKPERLGFEKPGIFSSLSLHLVRSSVGVLARPKRLDAAHQPKVHQIRVTLQLVSNDRSPTQYGQEYNGPLRERWNSPFGLAVRRMSPIVWPGVPPEAFMGFTSIAGTFNPGTTNTADPPVLNDFAEIGYFQTEAGPRGGPAPNPDPSTAHNHWGALHADPMVVRLLGRSASMTPDAWKILPDDQAAVGLVNLRQYTDHLAALLPANIRPSRYDTMWAVAMAFTGFSAGVNAAKGLFLRYATRLAPIAEAKRWQYLLWMLAVDLQNGFHPSGGAGRHGNVAYDALRTMQKFESGRQLAVSVGGNAAWFDLGMGAQKAAEETIIQNAAYGSAIERFSALTAPVVRAGNTFFTVVGGLMLAGIGVKLLWPMVRGNPAVPSIPPTIRGRHATLSPDRDRDTVEVAGRYRVMRASAAEPCKERSCRVLTKKMILSENTGGGYGVVPVCPKHLPEYRAAYDRDGYVEHYRENPSRSYDHEKLLLAVSNHRGSQYSRRHLEDMSYRRLYGVARELGIRQ